MPQWLDSRDARFTEGFDALVAARRGADDDVAAEVARIVADVRTQGDAALIRYTERFDRVRLTPDTLRLTPEQVDAAAKSCDPAVRSAIELAASRIADYHRRQLPTDIDYRDNTSVRLGARWTAVGAAGVYVPGGTAAYPSSVLMNALPAKAAGVGRIVMTVPAPDGKLDPAVLAAAKVAGVAEIYRIGGAQAIAALAFGTETVSPVDKVVGPGNAYVAAAKRQVFGVVGIDMIAGPSEILVVADGDNDPSWIAADMLSQAEHDAAAQAILITDDRSFAEQVADEIDRMLVDLPRRDIARRSWETNGAVIVVETLEQAIPLVDRLAPEHLELAVAAPDELAARIRNAGAIFLGRHAPEAIGDYVAGPNHVLPTARSARFSSGLGVTDFLKRTSIIGCDESALAAIGPAAVTLARAEGLEAHARSIAIRLSRKAGD